MRNTFNDLFNDFLNKGDKPKKVRKGAKKITPKSETKPNTGFTDITSYDSTIKGEVKRIIDVLKNFTQTNPFQSFDEDMEKKLDMGLGKPDKIEFFEEDGLFYEKRTWHTPNGDMVKVIVSDDPSMLSQPPKPEKTLNQQLNEAIANEEYEKAAAIRDKINNRKSK